MHKTDLLTAPQFILEADKHICCAAAVYRAIGNGFVNLTPLLSGCTNSMHCYDDLA